jgi:hypothetical protein
MQFTAPAAEKSLELSGKKNQPAPGQSGRHPLEEKMKTREKIEPLIKKLEKRGYSVLIRNKGSKKVISWSTKTHWASASFIENSETDLKRVYQRLKETIFNYRVIGRR